jgi:hypothetical protein
MCHISHLGLLLHGHLPSFELWFVLIVTMIICNFLGEGYFSRWQLRCSWLGMVVVLKPIWETLFSILSQCRILQSTNYCYISSGGTLDLITEETLGDGQIMEQWPRKLESKWGKNYILSNIKRYLHYYWKKWSLSLKPHIVHITTICSAGCRSHCRPI